jgi:Domain of unknown function (DUF4112)
MANAYEWSRGDALSRRASLQRLDKLSTPQTFDLVLKQFFAWCRGAGDIAASALSCWVLGEAYRLGVPRLLLIRMIGNVVIEGIAGAVPVGRPDARVADPQEKRRQPIINAPSAERKIFLPSSKPMHTRWCFASCGAHHFNTYPLLKKTHSMLVTIIPTAAAVMTAVATHPTTRRTPVTINCPMIFLLEVMSIIMAMIGTATTPFITALQKSALIGSIGENVIAMPVRVATTTVA